MNKRALEHLRLDPVMERVIERVGTITHRPKRLPPFESLLRSIVYQQLSGKAAGTILGRVLDLFGGKFPSPRMVLATAPETFRAAGLSGQKTGYILGLAREAENGRVPTLAESAKMTDTDLIECLTAIKGIGQWTVEMFLIFNLGRPDVLPVHDLGVRRGFQLARGKRIMPEPEQLARHGKRWAPHRTAAALYLWQAADFDTE